MADGRGETAGELALLGFASSLKNWEKTLGQLLTQLRYPGQSKSDPPPNLDGLAKALNLLRNEIAAASNSLNNVDEVLRLRGSEANLHAAVVNAWPAATAARETLLLGAGIFGAGGAAYAALGYPRASAELVPSLALWAAGLGLIIWGLNRLVLHESKRWAYFEATLDFPRK